jgi:NADH dehydrogenase [ubiquinone] 1 alpha subcomplex assembly factor 1
MNRESDGRVLFDFKQTENAGGWRTVDDTVMGGRSHSCIEIAGGVLVFSGELSLENDGGFCSVRSKLSRWDLSAYEGLSVTIRTGDRAFTLTARNEPGRDTVGHHHPLPVTGDEWQTVHALFADFEATYHGRVLEEHPGLNTTDVRSVGLLIADEHEGPFRLEIARIVAFGSD